MTAESFQEGMGFGQVLARSAFALVQVRYRIQAQAINAEVEPEVQHPRYLPVNLRIIVIEVGLMGIKAVPIIGLRDRIQLQFDGSKSRKMIRASR
jgi:hypothetical protein